MLYLSDEWLAAADAAIRTAAATAPAGRLIIEQHIDELVSYRVVIAPDEACLSRLEDDRPTLDRADAVFSQSEATARSIARRDTDAHQAFLLGQIRFDGDVDVLITHREAFAWLDEVLAPVVAATSF